MNQYSRYESMYEVKGPDGDAMTIQQKDRKDWEKDAQYIDTAFSLPMMPVFSEFNSTTSARIQATSGQP